MKKLAFVLLLLSSLAWAGPAHTCRAATSGSSTGQNCTLSSTSSNDLIVVMQSLRKSSATSTMTVTDTFGDTFTLACAADWSSLNNNDSMLTIWYASIGGGSSGNDTVTTTFASSAAGETLYAAEYSLTGYTLDPNACTAIRRNAASGALTTNNMNVLDDNELLITVAGATGTPANLTLNDVNFSLQDSQSTTTPRWADRTLGASTAGTNQTTSWTDSASVDMAIVMVAFTSGAHASAALVQKAAKNNSTAVTSTALAFPSNVSGNHLLICMFESNQSLSPTISDTLSLSWSSFSQNWNGTGSKLTFFYTTTGSSSGAETVTVSTASSTTGPMYIAEYGGSHPWVGSVLDAHTGTNGNSTSGSNYNSGNITTTGASDLLITVSGLVGVSASGYLTANSSWLRQGNDPAWPAAVQWADRIAGTAGTYSADWLSNNTAGGFNIIAAFGPGHPASARKVRAQVY